MGQAGGGPISKHIRLAAVLLLGRGWRSDAAILDLGLFPWCISPLMPALGMLASLLPAIPLPAGDLCGPWPLLVAARSLALQRTCLPC